MGVKGGEGWRVKRVKKTLVEGEDEGQMLCKQQMAGGRSARTSARGGALNDRTLAKGVV